MRIKKKRNDWIRLPMVLFQAPYTLSPTEACILAIMLDSVDYTDPTGIYYTDTHSISDIQSQLNTGRNTVLRALKKMEELGLIQRDTEHGRKNTYIIDNKIIKPKGE